MEFIQEQRRFVKYYQKYGLGFRSILLTIFLMQASKKNISMLEGSQSDLTRVSQIKFFSFLILVALCS